MTAAAPDPAPDPPPAATSAALADLGALFAAHAAFLVRVARRLTGSQAAAEDLVQDAFLVAHRRRDALAAAPDARAWLYRTTVHLVQHHHRARQRQRGLLERLLSREVAPAAPRPDDGLEARDRARRLEDCLARMPLPQREVLVLYELEALEGREVAALLEVPEGTVWRRLHDARRTFERLWRQRALVEGEAP